MAEANIPQWNVLCICESPADHHCNTCGDLLCSRCLTFHLKSRASSDHVVVPYAERIEPQNTSSIKCFTHQNQISELWCKTCDIPACLLCVTTAEHKKHDFIAIADQIGFRREKFRTILNEQNNSLLEWEKLSSDSKKISVDYEDHVNKLDAAMAKRADEISTEVTNIKIKHQKQLRQKQSTQIEILHATEKTINDGIICIKNENKKIEDILRDRELSTLLHSSPKTITELKLTAPSLISPTYHDFTPGHLETRALEQMFGCFALKTSKPSQNDSTMKPETYNDKELKAVNRTEESIHETEQEMTNNTQRKVFLTTSPSTIFSVKISDRYMVPYLSCCRGSDGAWICHDGKTLKLMERDGEILQTIKIDFKLKGMEVTKEGDLLVSDSTNKCIKSVSRKTITALFNTGMSPSSICSLTNGDILLTFPENGRVIQYNREGKVVQELDSAYFRCPVFLAKNDITQDIYVCDRESQFIFSPGYVLMFNSSGSLRYKYSGLVNADFNPRGICTDQGGRVLIADYNKSKVHVLDKNGHFLGYINTAYAGLTNPCDIDVDNDGYAWIGCGEKLGVLKYLQYQ